jgi:hypothetical protein
LPRPSAAFAAVIAAAAIACSSSSSLPPQAANCEPRNGVPCGPPVGGGGGTSAPVDAGSDASDAAIVGIDGSTCGGTETLLAATSECTACIVSATGSPTGTGCCTADLDCRATDCFVFAACAHNCPAGDNACLMACVAATSGAGIVAYQDFAMCLQINCPTQCAGLTVSTNGDI